PELVSRAEVARHPRRHFRRWGSVECRGPSGRICQRCPVRLNGELRRSEGAILPFGIGDLASVGDMKGYRLVVSAEWNS
ncbi:hypothetical protein AVEN_48501-1, partial [Araneus ventricosus]